VLAQYREKGILVAIQTKTASPGNPFMMDLGIERVSSAENEWVVLVKLHKLGTRPNFFVVPHNHVSAVAYALHKRSLATPRRDGQPRRDHSRRTLRATQFLDYEDQWDLLLQPTSLVPNRLGADYAECVAQWGAPGGASWYPAPRARACPTLNTQPSHVLATGVSRSANRTRFRLSVICRDVNKLRYAGEP